MRKALIAATALLAGCSMAPPYQLVKIAVPPAFGESGAWVPSDPAQQPAGPWWSALDDPQFTALEARLDRDNPTLAAALARHDAALAILGEANGRRLPTIDLGANASANRQSAHRPLRGSNQPDLYPADTLGGIGSFDLDLWGRLRNTVAAARADAQASADDEAAVRLALETDLATAYAEIRGIDRLIALLDATVATYDHADRLTRNRFVGGIASGIDAGRSGAQLADAQTQLAEARGARAIVEHAIAALIGEPASGFRLAPSQAEFAAPAIPLGLPSTLLQRRPDVAAAERRMFAANRRIGIARAAFFPDISLGGALGYQNTGLAGLIAAPNLFWSAGPGTVLNLFDGGRRRARVAQARAGWELATAEYRGTVLGAFQQVEDALSRLRFLGEEQAAAGRTVAAASQAARLSMNRYDQGAASFLDVVVAQTAELSARRRAIGIATQREQARISLIRALGGGWSAGAAAAAR